MSRARNIRRRNARRSTCSVCRSTPRSAPLKEWQGLALCTGCYWIASTTGDLGLAMVRWSFYAPEGT